MITSQSPIHGAGDVTATDYGAVERLIAETNRRHDAVSAVARWRSVFRLFKQTKSRIGVDEENETEKNSYLSVVRKIKEDGYRMLKDVEDLGIDTERECGIRLGALKACVEEIEDDEGFLFLDPQVVEKLNRYFGLT